MLDTPIDGTGADDPLADRRRVIEATTFEIVPLTTVDEAIIALPPGSSVSVTCSPVKGIAATRGLVDRVRSAGHRAIPHLAARMVASRDEVVDLARWLRSESIDSVLVIAGDAESPHGPYPDGTSLLRDLVDADPGVTAIGVPAYPDGHPAHPRTDDLDRALHVKQAVLADAGIGGWATTQMCFDPEQLVAWGERARAGGLELPIHLGVPGVVERTRLMSMGMRLGVGASLRFLRKNRRSIGRLLMTADYDPDSLIDPLTPELGRLGITGLHCFTFNQVGATAGWREGALAR